MAKYIIGEVKHLFRKKLEMEKLWRVIFAKTNISPQDY
jgi:hypothetical protein